MNIHDVGGDAAPRGKKGSRPPRERVRCGILRGAREANARRLFTGAQKSVHPLRIPFLTKLGLMC